MNIFEKFVNCDLDNKIKIGVVGDAMIDEYFNVAVKKISPEFPIPVMHSETDESYDLPGGAANVAFQFKHFNAEPILFSLLDKEAEFVLSNHSLNIKNCISIDSKIPRKRRFYSDDFPTYRWDVEIKKYGLANLKEKCAELFHVLNREILNLDAVIFSDYEKGVFTESSLDINALVKKAKISIVDSKCGDLDRWVGCTVFKPNRNEALQLSGCNTLEKAGQFLLSRLNCQYVVVTKSGDGVSVFSKDGIKNFIPSKSISVESVIGAGDSFTSFLAMCLAQGLNINESVEIAWEASSLYVQNRHNKPIDVFSLLKNEKQINPFLLNKRDFKLVFANGCFDGGLTRGHIECLKYAKTLGDKLFVALNSDESVRRLKGEPRPYLSLEDRMKIISSLEFVDFVGFFEEDTPLSLIQKIKPDLIVKGGDYRQQDVVGYGLAEVVICPTFDSPSTTEKSNMDGWQNLIKS